MAKKTRTIYRDSKTGHFAKKSTWQRSRAQGGDRYKRERIKIGKKKPPKPPLPPPEPEGEVHEYIISFSYDKTGRQFDIIVTARSEEEAREVSKGFLKSDTRGRNISRSKFSGWSQGVARGRRTDADAGEAEYREDSEEV